MSRALALLLGLLVAVLPLAGRAAASDIVLQVFPLVALDTIDPAAGSDLTTRLASEIAGLGRVRVLTDNPLTAPADRRAVARSAGAEVYLTGSIAPVGTGVSVIVQIVSTRSATVLWSSTSQLARSADITGVGTRVHEMLMARDQRNYVDLATATAPVPAAVPASKAHPAAAPKAAPTPAAPLPIPAADVAEAPVQTGPNAIVMLGFSGAGETPARSLAARSIITAFAQRGVRAGSDPTIAAGPVAIWADRICTETSARMLLSGSVALDVPRADGVQSQLMTARVELLPYNCRRRAFDNRVIRSNASLVWTAAVSRAALAAVTAISVPAKLPGGS